MDKLTTEQKAQRYDEVFNAAKEWYNNPNSSNIGKSYLYAVFPELKESEDEKIRKGLIKAFGSIGKKEWGGVNVKNAIAWLEKQGEQKPSEEYNITGIGSKHAQGKLGEMIAIKKGEKPTEWSEEYIADVFEKVGLAKIVREQSNDALTIALQDAMIELSNTLQPKPAGWSEEDETSIAVNNPDAYKIGFADGEAYAKEEQWKPSDEQMAALNNAILLNEDHYNGAVLSTLREQLMKLK